MLRLIADDLVPPEWVLLLTVAALFAWGFSRRLEEVVMPLTLATQAPGSQAPGPERP